MTPALREAARRLAAMGQGSDTILAHISPREAVLLDWLNDRRVDYPRNRRTGLPAYDTSSDRSDNSGPGGGGRGEPGGSASTSGVGDGTPGTADNASNMGGHTNGADRSGLHSTLPESSYYTGPLTTESILSTPDNYRAEGYEGISMTQYAPRDTWARVLQELWNPSIQHQKYGLPTGMAPHGLRTAVGMLAPGALSGLMGLGAAMGRAQSPAAQAASMAHNQALGAQNSTGHDTAAPNQRIAQWIAESNQPQQPQPMQPFKPPSIQDLGGGDSLIQKLALQPGLLGAIVGGGLLGWPT